MSINGGADSDNDISGWDTNTVFNETTFDIGRYAKADIAELIVYNRVLSSTEIAEVKGYLNTKFKIY